MHAAAWAYVPLEHTIMYGMVENQWHQSRGSLPEQGIGCVDQAHHELDGSGCSGCCQLALKSIWAAHIHCLRGIRLLQSWFSSCFFLLPCAILSPVPATDCILTGMVPG